MELPGETFLFNISLLALTFSAAAANHKHAVNIELEGLEIIDQRTQRLWIDADGRLGLNSPIVDAGFGNSAGPFIRP